MADENVLQDGRHRRVVRIGDTVRRPVQPWTPAVHALLRHLEDVGFPYAPRVKGIDGQGRDILTYVEGKSGPKGWAGVVDDAGLMAFARLLRAYHDAVTGFRLPEGLRWWTGESSPDGEGENVVCHGDFGPWNIIWRDGAPWGCWTGTMRGHRRDCSMSRMRWSTSRRSGTTPSVCRGWATPNRPTGGAGWRYSPWPTD